MYDPLKTKVKIVFYSSTAFLFGLGIASGLGWTGPSYAMPTIETEPMIPVAAVQPAADLSQAFVNISDAVTPSVVRIRVRRPGLPVAQGGGQIPFLNRFRSPSEEEGSEGSVDPEDAPIPRDRVGGGSGFIISRDGYILTNNHVVEDAKEIQVFLSDRTAYNAELVGRDPFTDVAVIKIEGDDFQPMSFGDSDDVAVGEWIVAIGNPGFGSGTTLDYSVTTGIVSAIGRPLQLLNRELFNDPDTRGNNGFAIENFIQTDAVINPGNSGGPMVNLRGQVVGINSAIATETGFYQGYGFAIPINLAYRIMEDLIEYGRVRRPYLGVRLDAVDDVSAEYHGLPAVSGVEIEGITDGGPAGDFGIREQDVIWAVEGEPVASQGQLQANIAERRPGDEVTLTVYRDRRRMEIDVTLGEIDLGAGTTRGTVSVPEADYPTLGLQLENMDRATARAPQVQLDREGVLIVGVEPNSPVTNLRNPMGPGWRLAEVDGVEVHSAREARRALESALPGSVVSLRVIQPTVTGPQTATYHVRVPGGR